MPIELKLAIAAVAWMVLGSACLGAMIVGWMATVSVLFARQHSQAKTWWEEATLALGLERTAAGGHPVLRGEVDGYRVQAGVGRSSEPPVQVPVWEVLVEVPQLTVPVLASPRWLAGKGRRLLRISGAAAIGDARFDERYLVRIASGHRAWLTADRLASLTELLRMFDNVEFGEGRLRASSFLAPRILSRMEDAVRLAVRHAAALADGPGEP
jgi:hypothetical protein